MKRRMRDTHRGTVMIRRMTSIYRPAVHCAMEIRLLSGLLHGILCWRRWLVGSAGLASRTLVYARTVRHVNKFAIALPEMEGFGTPVMDDIRHAEGYLRCRNSRRWSGLRGAGSYRAGRC